MPRHARDPNDRPINVAIDAAFVGIDNRRDADLAAVVPGPGHVTEAINTRFRDGHITTRPGCCAPVAFNPVTFESIRGAAAFADPDGQAWLMVADPRTTWLCADGRAPVRVDLPAGLQLVAPVVLVQCFSQMVMFRGDAEPLLWSGDTTRPWTRASQVTDLERPAYIKTVPSAGWGVVMADRLFAPLSRDAIAWSDVLDFNRFDTSLNVMRFNQGDDDAIVAAARYQGSKLVVFKSRSVWFVDNVFGDMASIRVDKLPGAVGCIARASVCEVGGDLVWLAHGGVHRMSQTEQGNLRGATLPLSEPIKATMKRINWGAADQACAAVVDNLYLLAVPLDGARVNNAVLVYDLTTEKWVSVDVYGGEISTSLRPSSSFELSIFDSSAGAAMHYESAVAAVPLQACSSLVTGYLFDQPTAFFVQSQRVLALGHGDVDRYTADSEAPIRTRVITRGYSLESMDVKSLGTITAVLQARDATLSMSVLTEGVNERLPVVVNQRVNRQRYRVLGKRRFELTDGARYAEPFREDYHWQADDALALPAQGVELGLMQDRPLSTKLRRDARWFALELECSRGRLKLESVEMAVKLTPKPVTAAA
jgi:hypothetical protein